MGKTPIDCFSHQLEAIDAIRRQGHFTVQRFYPEADHTPPECSVASSKAKLFPHQLKMLEAIDKMPQVQIIEIDSMGGHTFLLKGIDPPYMEKWERLLMGKLYGTAVYDIDSYRPSDFEHESKRKEDLLNLLLIGTAVRLNILPARPLCKIVAALRVVFPIQT